MKLRKVLSGGQTGADQTGVECAAALGLETGGTMPKGFRTEAGNNPKWAKKYGLTEHPSMSYVPRTRLNVKNADVTLWFGRTDSLGCRCMKKACQDYCKPFVVNPTAEDARRLAETYEVWNIVGNQASTNPNVVNVVKNFFRVLFGKFCLCTPDKECDFHKRGGYVTAADEVSDGNA